MPLPFRATWHLVAVAAIAALPGRAVAQASRSSRALSTAPARWADTNGWKLVLERTLQPAEGTPGALDDPSDAVLVSDGRVITVDWRRPAIRLYDQHGNFVRALGRAGDGPGEYRNPSIALFHDSLFVYDPQLRRLTVMNPGGKIVRTVITTANDGFPLHIVRHGLIAVHASTFTPDGPHPRWVYLTRMGVPVDSIPAQRRFFGNVWTFGSTDEGPSEWNIPFPPSTEFELLPDGGAVYGRTDSYTLVITRTGTDTLHLFGRSNAPVFRIPAAARDSAFQLAMTKHPALRAVAKLSDLPQFFPLWSSLHIDGAGNIWVGARVEREEASRFDVFSPTGVFLGSVAAPFGPTAKIDFQGEQLTVVDADADDLPRVRVYRIDRRG